MLEHIFIDDFAPFENFNVSFLSQLTVIAGTNGVGKSRLLESIVSNLIANINRNDGFIENRSDSYLASSYLSSAKPPYVLLNPTRQIPFVAIDSLRPMTMLRSTLHQGTDGFKAWFVNAENHVFRGRNIDFASLENFELVKRVFSILDPEISYSEVDENFNIVLNTPDGPLYFEKLSSGFQSAFKLIFEVISFVEMANSGNLRVSDYSGIILIDEVDVHLHPTWQGSILYHLKSLFPKAQIIATTHSAHVIQGLKEEELIVLEREADGSVRRKSIKPSPGPYGFKGWTVEEILRDVMGLKDSISLELQQAEAGFNNALDNEDPDAAKPYYDQLMMMLHPKNGLRRVYDIQFESIGGNGQ